jgi:hypothetical protein
MEVVVAEAMKGDLSPMEDLAVTVTAGTVDMVGEEVDMEEEEEQATVEVIGPMEEGEVADMVEEGDLMVLFVQYYYASF